MNTVRIQRLQKMAKRISTEVLDGMTRSQDGLGANEYVSEYDYGRIS